MNIWEQVDSATGCNCCPHNLRYSWMVQRSYATRVEMQGLGWKWIPGRPRGVFVTNDAAAVERFRRLMAGMNPEQIAPPIVSNGSHQRLGAPMHDVWAARENLRREYATAGLDPTVEIEGYLDMDADQLRDELAYLADYQG